MRSMKTDVHITSYYIILLHHITSYYIILHHITSYYIILHHITSYYIGQTTICRRYQTFGAVNKTEKIMTVLYL